MLLNILIHIGFLSLSYIYYRTISKTRTRQNRVRMLTKLCVSAIRGGPAVSVAAASVSAEDRSRAAEHGPGGRC